MKNKRIPSLSFFSLLILLFGLVLVETVSGEARGEYVRTFTRDIIYGRGKGNVGLLSIEGHRRLGPESFTNDSEGNLYICDTVNQRIQAFASNGKHQFTIPLEKGAMASDIAVDGSGLIYIYDDMQGKLHQYNKKGKLLTTMELDTTRWQSRGPLHIVNDNIYVASSDQEDVLIGKIVNGRLLAQRSQSPTKGIHGFSGRRYFVTLTRWKSGRIQIIDRTGATYRVIHLPLIGLVSMRFLQEDRERNFYIQTERINGEVSLDVYKFDPKGQHLTVIHIPETDYYSWSVKLLSVDENGSIYQFLPARGRGRLNVFREYKERRK